jgi:hypothetical protein
MKTSLLPFFVAALLTAAQPARADIPVPNAREGLALISSTSVIRLSPYIVRPGMPAVTRMVEPRISPKYLGQRLDLRFFVDVKGRAVDIVAVNVGSDWDLVAQLGAAIKAWEFEPARDAAGNPRECAVILPVEIGFVADLDEAGLKRSPEPARLRPYYVRVNQDEPAALEYVIPRISRDYVGERCVVQFVVDGEGRPYQLTTIGSTNRDFIVQLTSAIAAWRFDPARDSAGNPIERTMLLPVEIQ